MDAKPWHKRPDETTKSYFGLSTYLEQGRERSLVAVQQALGHRSKSTITLWSSKYDWVARAEAYDLAKLEIVQAQELAREQELKALAHSGRLGMQQLALDAAADVFLALIDMAKGVPKSVESGKPAKPPNPFAQLKAAELVFALAGTLPSVPIAATPEPSHDPDPQAVGESEGEELTTAEIEAIIEDYSKLLAIRKQADAAHQSDPQAAAPS